MTQYPHTTTDPARLHRALQEDYAGIERRIDDFLVQRGGVGAATLGLREAITSLRRHIHLEEEILFPALRRAGMTGPVFAMSTEHFDLWSTMDRMEQRLADGCSQAEQQEVGRMLMAELDRHSSKEEPIVFGHAEDVLAPEDLADVRAFVESATLPPGWVPQEPEGA
ncbi:MAG: hemerythrin domain-containing protein [Nocardioides sp.]|nr:hemerythrin domain-containing protein [Nocardioides sp.]